MTRNQILESISNNLQILNIPSPGDAIHDETLDELKAYDRSLQQRVQREHEASRVASAFNENEVGGAWDGFQVTSDADPGL